MPRQQRTLSQTGIYHVMIRGNERKPVLLKDEDKQSFLKTLLRKKKEIAFELYAYCIMDNHVHLLINDCGKDISHIMHSINTRYAQDYNRKYQRVGHVFQDRFRSETIEVDSYLLVVMRYIHNNPVKAGMVKTGKDYKWSSYSYYLNDTEGEKIVDCDVILGLFSNERMKAIVELEKFMQVNEESESIAILEDKEIISAEDAIAFIQSYLRTKNLQIDLAGIKDNAGLRNEIIIELRKNSSLSIRQIASLLGVNRGVVARAKM